MRMYKLPEGRFIYLESDPPPGFTSIKEYLEEKGVDHTIRATWVSDYKYTVRATLNLPLKMWSHVISKTIPEISKKHLCHYSYRILKWHPDSAKILVIMKQ